MTTLTDLSQLTKSMVKKPVEEPKPAPTPKMQESPVDREAAEVLAYFARPGGNAPHRAQVASRADPAKDRVAELVAALEAKDTALAKLAEETTAADERIAELERRKAELRQILKDNGYFNDPRPLERLGMRLISGRNHWKLQYGNERVTLAKTPSDFRANLNSATEIANRCF